ncbi:unnamed protein product [Caenorhabditis angaria]|uniref:Peptidase M13 C-terminal domain-containing protein n=1 Tax=Caenorhabditis angaria TaxID=860376 RepID=A0A9P1J4M1_9PELO|nr:unnamed protein product [Caenorhabditis angaria]
MIKFFLAFFLILNSHPNVESAISELLQMIEDNIDPSIDPCDNFYRHSCDVNKPVNETMFNLAIEMYREIINNLTLTDKFEYGNRLEANDSSIIALEVFLDNNQTENIQKVADDFFESCVHKNMTVKKYILQALETTFPKNKFKNLIYDSNCERSSELLRKNLEKVWYNEIKTKKASYDLSAITGYIRSNAYMSVNRELFEKHREYMDEFKDEIESLVKVTPWVDQSDTENYYKNLLNITWLKEISDYENDINDLKHLNNLLSMCRLKLDTINAFNARSNISFHHAMMFVYTLSTSPGLLYGGTGFVMAHEIGHSFVKSAHDYTFVPYSPESFKSCVQEQFNSTCSIYKEKECKTSDHQFDENGSDIFGLKLAFDLMKKKYSEKMNEVVEGSRYNLTNAEVFFYVPNIIYCWRSQSKSSLTDSHHAHNARMNAASVQVPEFQRIFGCDNNSRMMKSKTKQCILFGQDASD